MLSPPQIYENFQTQWYVTRGFAGKYSNVTFLYVCRSPEQKRYDESEFVCMGSIQRVESVAGQAKQQPRLSFKTSQGYIVLDVAFFKLSNVQPTRLYSYIAHYINKLALSTILKTVSSSRSEALDYSASEAEEGGGDDEDEPGSNEDDANSAESEPEAPPPPPPKKQRQTVAAKEPKKKKTAVLAIEDAPQETGKKTKGEGKAPGVAIKEKKIDKTAEQMEEINKNKYVQGVIYLPVTCMKLPPKDETGERPLQVRKIYADHVRNLKDRIRSNPNAHVAPIVVLVDRSQCMDPASYDRECADQYTHYVLGGNYSFKARRQLFKEKQNPRYLSVLCAVYCGLTSV